VGEDVRELVEVLKDIRDKLVGLYSLSTAVIYLGFGSIVGFNILLSVVVYPRVSEPLSTAILLVFWILAILALNVLILKMFGKPIAKFREMLRGGRGDAGRSRRGFPAFALVWSASFVAGYALTSGLSYFGLLSDRYVAQLGLLTALALGNILMSLALREWKVLMCGVAIAVLALPLPLTGSFDAAWTYASGVIVTTYNLTGIAYVIEATRLIVGSRKG